MVGSAPGTGERIVGVRFTDDTLSADLSDGRTITVPIAWYPRLQRATPAERANWRISGGGYGLHWPDIDEDVSSDGLLRGAAAPGTRRQAPSPSGRSMRYAVVIERSRTGFAAWVPDLPGCVAAAESQEELRRMIKEAIEFHIEALEESGQRVPEPLTGVEYVDV
jgi:predicted RNase H-like HicB family nuclease